MTTAVLTDLDGFHYLAGNTDAVWKNIYISIGSIGLSSSLTF